MTDVVALFDRRALLTAPFRNSSSSACLPTSRSSAASPGFVLLKQDQRRPRLRQSAGLVLLNPDPDQVSTDVVTLGEPMQGLAGQELLSDLALEFDAVRAVLGDRDKGRGERLPMSDVRKRL